jgi:two-component system NarL family sensor kinase
MSRVALVDVPIGRVVAIVVAIDAVAIAVVLSRYSFDPVLAESAEDVWNAAIARVHDHVRAIVEPTVSPELVRGEPRALAAFDEVIRSQDLHADAAGVMLGTLDGVVVYSLESDAVGQQFALPTHVRDSLRDGASSATLGALAARADAQIAVGQLSPTIDVFSPVRGPNGESLVWCEQLWLQDVASASGGPRVRVAVGGAMLLAAQALLVATMFIWREQRRRQRGWLMQVTSELNLAERRRFAADLHNGPLQDLTGIVLELDRPESGEGSTMVAGRTDLAVRLRGAMASLRNAMSEIYPSEHAIADVPAAIGACLERTDPRVTQRLVIDPLAVVRPEFRWLTIQVTKEALWNAVVHGRADSVTVGLYRDGDHVVLIVHDDGAGFAPDRTRSLRGDHLGLTLLDDMATAAGATLAIDSAPGAGTTVRLELPQ